MTEIVDTILAARVRTPATRSVLAAISGIDGSGKGYVTAKVVEALQARGARVASLGIDGWLNLPAVRFSQVDPAEHFYLRALRFGDMFSQLVLPLRDRRAIDVEVDFAEETATAYRRQRYAFADVDIIVLEGVYLLKRAFQSFYDVSFWIECSFATALERALARGQEGLSRDDTIAAYRTIYFPAQEIHFARDDPRRAATMIVDNEAPA